jgi:multidrug efflux pump subunit AcrA (membrane-fusion protein)
MKLIGIAAVGLAIFFAIAKGDYRVTAPTTLEGVVQRAVVAPFNGYVAEAPARAGDVVQEGHLLCLLDEPKRRRGPVMWCSRVRSSVFLMTGT